MSMCSPRRASLLLIFCVLGSSLPLTAFSSSFSFLSVCQKLHEMQVVNGRGRSLKDFILCWQKSCKVVSIDQETARHAISHHRFQTISLKLTNFLLLSAMRGKISISSQREIYWPSRRKKLGSDTKHREISGTVFNSSRNIASLESDLNLFMKCWELKDFWLEANDGCIWEQAEIYFWRWFECESSSEQINISLLRINDANKASGALAAAIWW